MILYFFTATEQEQMVATLPSTASSLDMPKEELVAMEINTELENHTKIETDLNSAKDIECKICIFMFDS